MQDHQYRLRFRSVWVSMGWMIALVIVFLSLTPRPIPLPGEQGDKLGHALAYAVLMLWFAQVYLYGRQRVAVAALCVALGIALEFAQLLTETRTFSVADMGADALGVGLGWLAAPPRGLAFLRRLEDAGAG